MTAPQTIHRRGLAQLRECDAHPLTVAVGILTYKRQPQLDILLHQLSAQQTMCSRYGIQTTVIVVDNDPAASALATVAKHAGVRYVLESTPGIAASRARCQEEARGLQLLQFVDDDEIPEPSWLMHMISAWSQYGRPAAVAGSVSPRFCGAIDPWIEAGGFFNRRQLSCGSEVSTAPAGNLLLDLGQLDALGVRFDASLGFHGGEDTLLTRQLKLAGGRIVFCPHAVVHDLVPPDRATRSWVLKRAWHHGSVSVMLDLRALERPKRTVRRLEVIVAGAGRVVAGGGGYVLGILSRNLRRQAEGAKLMWRGAGMIAAATDCASAEYQRAG